MRKLHEMERKKDWQMGFSWFIWVVPYLWKFVDCAKNILPLRTFIFIYARILFVKYNIKKGEHTERVFRKKKITYSNDIFFISSVECLCICNTDDSITPP